MTEPDYLTAKRSIDDRALDTAVLERFASALDESRAGPKILEVGAGTGTMVARLSDRGLLPDGTTYLAVDQDPTHIEHARESVPDWLAASGYALSEDGDTLVAERNGRAVRVRFEVADALALDVAADAVVAGAFLDLLSIPDGLERLSASLDGGVLYAPITFDGLTGFVPRHPDDTAVTRAYHRHMQYRDQPGRPDAGRAVIEAIPAIGGEVLAVGGSDWIIRPENDAYPGDEALVVDHLLSTIVAAVSSLDDSRLSEETLDDWETTRRRQLESAELTFLAHNLDILARF